jgi:hypothetical protein
MFRLLKIGHFSLKQLTDVKMRSSLNFLFRSCCMTLHIVRLLLKENSCVLKHNWRQYFKFSVSDWFVIFSQLSYHCWRRFYSGKSIKIMLSNCDVMAALRRKILVNFDGVQNAAAINKTTDHDRLVVRDRLISQLCSMIF